MKLSVLGILKISFRQAEGRRVKSAVLCLKYIASLAAAFTAFFLGVRSGDMTAKTALAGCALPGIMTALWLRGVILRRAYAASTEYLSCPDRRGHSLPGSFAVLLWQSAYLAVIASVYTVMLSPSYICLRAGIDYYRLSSGNGNFLLLLAASLLLAAAGLLFSAVISARLGCAAYLWFSGKCGSAVRSMECSWELTRGCGGEIIRLRLFSLFFGLPVSALCNMNFSHALLRQKGFPSTRELCVLLIGNRLGEQHLELA